MTEAVASGTGQIPALVERLRTTEAKRRDLRGEFGTGPERRPKSGEHGDDKRDHQDRQGTERQAEVQ